MRSGNVPAVPSCWGLSAVSARDALLLSLGILSPTFQLACKYPSAPRPAGPSQPAVPSTVYCIHNATPLALMMSHGTEGAGKCWGEGRPLLTGWLSLI